MVNIFLFSSVFKEKKNIFVFLTKMSLCNKSTSVIRKLLKLENDEILETLNKKKEVKNNNKKLVLFHKIDKQSNLLNNLKN